MIGLKGAARIADAERMRTRGKPTALQGLLAGAAVLVLALAGTVPVQTDGGFTGRVDVGAVLAAGNSFGLTQQPQTARCVSDTGTAGACADGTALDRVLALAVSPDGAHAYGASATSEAVNVFARDTTTGALTQLPGTAGCVSETGSGGACADGTALVGASGVTVSPDGAHVYVAAYVDDALSVFARDASTGALTQLSGSAGCVSETGTGGACADARGLDEPYDVRVSPDGEHVYANASVSGGVAVFARDATTGALTQLAGTAGCVTETGTGGACADGKAMDNPQDLALSPDGAHLYLASFDPSDALAVFARDATTGALTQLAGTAGCVSETGTGGACTDGTALDGATDVVVGPDGAHVYVASSQSAALAVFARDVTTGALTQLAGTAGCVSELGTGGTCADGTALLWAEEVTVSDDGAHVYATGRDSDAVSVFVRDATSGALTQLEGTAGCTSETGTGGACADSLALDETHDVVLSPGGAHAYVAAATSGAVSVLTRDTVSGVLTPLSGCISDTGGACGDGTALSGAEAVAVSPDGGQVYAVAGSSDAVVAFRRAASGALSQLPGTGGCVSETGSAGACADGSGLDGADHLAVSPDGEHVYVVSEVGDALAALARDATSGALTQLPGTAGCVSETGSGGACADGSVLDGLEAVAVSPDGAHVYVASGASDAVVGLARDGATGELTQLACVSETGSGGACADGTALDGPEHVAISGDGVHVYVASEISDAVAVFARNGATGALTQLGCVSDTGSGGACADGTALDGALEVALSPEGSHVYVASPGSSSVGVFSRDATTGVLTQLGCASETGSGGLCADVRGLDGARGVVVSPDGQNVYVASLFGDAVAAFRRDTATGGVSQMADARACISQTGGTCATGIGLDGAASVVVSPDGADVYAASRVSESVAVLGRTR